MGEKDVTQKVLEAYNDVFADIVNVLLFGGEQVLAPDELEEQTPRSYYKADGKIREIERDVAKRWKNGNIRIACVGIENQTNPDPDMALRVIGYDGAEYRAQLLSGKEGDSRYPVVTLVLYFGYKKRWDQPRSLRERLYIPPRFEQYVNDYRINLFEVAYLTKEQVELFQSDFRVVAEFFVQMQENGEYIPSPQKLEHVQETLQLLSVMTNDKRFEEAYNKDVKGGADNMLEFLDKIEAKGRREGLLEGHREGREEGLREGHKEGHKEGSQEAHQTITVRLYKKGMTADEIAEIVGEDVETVKDWLADVSGRE